MYIHSTPALSYTIIIWGILACHIPLALIPILWTSISGSLYLLAFRICPPFRASISVSDRCVTLLYLVFTVNLTSVVDTPISICSYDDSWHVRS